MLPDLADNFPQYAQFGPMVPVHCVTPELGGCFHRFFDTSPITPSGRYVGLTRLPFEDLHLVRIQIVPPYSGESGELRVDPHPAWDCSFTRVAFDACPDGTRRLYVADCAEYL